jgi:hypothetical protein
VLRIGQLGRGYDLVFELQLQFIVELELREQLQRLLHHQQLVE